MTWHEVIRHDLFISNTRLNNFHVYIWPRWPNILTYHRLTPESAKRPDSFESDPKAAPQPAFLESTQERLEVDSKSPRRRSMALSFPASAELRASESHICSSSALFSDLASFCSITDSSDSTNGVFTSSSNNCLRLCYKIHIWLVRV